MTAPADLAKVLDSINADSFDGDDGQSLAVLQAAQGLVRRLEKPWYAITRFAWEQPAIFSVVCVAIDLKLFETLSNGGNKSIDELAAVTKASPELLARLCRSLASHSFFAQVDEQTFAANELTRCLATPEGQAAIRCSTDAFHPALAHIRDYMRQSGYVSPTSATDGIWQSALKTDLALFDWLKQRPALLQDFSAAMRGVTGAQDEWPSFTDVHSLLEHDDPSRPFLVDIGGSTGHDTRRFLARHPHMAGRLVVQDRPEVIAMAPPADGITFAGNDFFGPQPVQGARVYYLHHILHDWPDDRAHDILARIADAMAPGYSRVLIEDLVLKDLNPTGRTVGMDLCMMAFVAGRERTAHEWERLLASVGMRIVRIHRSLRTEQAVLEVELAG